MSEKVFIEKGWIMMSLVGTVALMNCYARVGVLEVSVRILLNLFKSDF